MNTKKKAAIVLCCIIASAFIMAGNHLCWNAADSTRASETRWVKARLVNRLGNQLFIAASSYGIARARNARWCIENLKNEEMDLEEKVQWLHQNTTPEPCPSSSPSVFVDVDEGPGFATYQPRLIQSYPNQNVRVGTYLNSYKYWWPLYHIPFKLRKREWGIAWAKHHGVKVGIHIRRTDYHAVAAYRKNLPPDLYYEFAVQYIHRLTNHSLPASSFWVASDDMRWVHEKRLEKNLFRGMQLSTFTEADDVMSVLSACTHMIAGAGTFSWWSMYMQQPSHPTKKKIQLYYHVENYLFSPGDIALHDVYPPWWTGIEIVGKQEGSIRIHRP